MRQSLQSTIFRALARRARARLRAQKAQEPLEYKNIENLGCGDVKRPTKLLEKSRKAYEKPLKSI